MAKAKKKKVEIEDNEFLKGLIEEVKSIDEDSAINIEGTSSGHDAFDNILAPNTQHEEIRVHGIFEPTSSSEATQKAEPGSAFQKLSEELKIDLNDPLKTIVSTETAQGSADATRVERHQDNSTQSTSPTLKADRTVAVNGGKPTRPPVLQEKVVSGSLKGTRNGQVYTSLDASLAQAETLKLAQDRIKELEYECDKLRQENDELVSASDVVTRRMEEMQARAIRLQKQKTEMIEQSKSEALILKGHLQYKDTELSKAKMKIEELESRLKSDFRKIRVRERELENRLELVRAEKQALMRSKDEKILDLQRKLDQFKSELDLYRSKVQDLNKSMEDQQDQMKKTVRALRVALSNLEHDEMTKIIIGEAIEEMAPPSDEEDPDKP